MPPDAEGEGAAEEAAPPVPLLGDPKVGLSKRKAHNQEHQSIHIINNEEKEEKDPYADRKDSMTEVFLKDAPP